MLTLDELERAAYINGDMHTIKLIEKIETEVIDGLLEDTQQKIEKEHEVADEQSEFRRALLEEIVGICASASRYSRFKETKELAASILAALSDSYVEL